MSADLPLDKLRALEPAAKGRMRKLIRKRLGECREALMRPLNQATRAYVSGYLAEAERALVAVSDGASA